MLQALQNNQPEKGDKTPLYPRQIRPDHLSTDDTGGGKGKKAGPSLGILDLFKSDGEVKSKASLAFENFKTVQHSVSGGEAGGKPTDFITHWQNVAVAKNLEPESLTRRMDAVLKNVKMSGFKQASSAKSWRVKGFWFFFIFMLFLVTVYEIAKCIQAYQNSPVTTKYTLSTPDALHFPKVYICYGSSFNRTFTLQHQDLMMLSTVYRSRSAVTIGGQNRRKRDTSGSDILDSSDEDIIRALLHSADRSDETDQSDYESDEWWKTPRGDQEEIDNAINYDQSDRDDPITRIKRQIVQINITNNASSEIDRAKSEQAKRIDQMMNAENISEIMYKYMKDAGHKVDGTFLECEFKGHSRRKLDCKDIIRPVLDSNYGMCFVVDLPDDMKQTVAGEGLRLLIDSHISIYPRANEGAPKYAGVLVSINKEHNEFNWLKSLAAPGRLTKIDLEASYVELLNLESGPLIQPCVQDDESKDKLKIFNGTYSITLCQMDCLFQAHRNMCQCILPLDKSTVKSDVLNDTEFCGPKQFKGCLANSASAADKLIKACRDACHSPCKSYRYEMRSSYALLNDRAFQDLNLPPNVTAKQLIDLRVAYSRKEIAQLVQSPSASFADLVANAGGHINLWMGASMITLLQMLFMAFGYGFWRVFMKIQPKVKLAKQ